MNPQYLGRMAGIGHSSDRPYAALGVTARSAKNRHAVQVIFNEGMDTGFSYRD
jgi:hypothetical protein